ncbi:hypothetical protein GVN24_24580 [Rhizobium sp. CRIBSB]|nr:hypothetical protein [Rhizobium sp. CRIBSB]
MVRRVYAPVSINAQMVAVRRAASAAAVAVAKAGRAGQFMVRHSAEAERDALVQAAATLQAVRDSAEALSMMPAAQREQLAIALAAGGYRAVRAEDPAPMETVHV